MIAIKTPDLMLALIKNQQKAQNDVYYPRWHLAPVCGLLNDPNGFIQHGNRYHLFYQWNPLDCNHNYKCWGHWYSDDLIHWLHAPIALLPENDYDINGCYSGSAITDQGKLTLFYTGNVKYNDGSRTAWQCMSVENSVGGFDKIGPIIALPEGYTGNVRDPKVWQHGNDWYMVLGAQNKKKQGRVLLYKTGNLQNWDLCGEIAGSQLNGLEKAGYMWECPDLFELDRKWILLACPQGITKEKHRFLNPHSSTYLIGDFNYQEEIYQHTPQLHELDAGFEFYAPQTTIDNQGRRLLVGWMGVPDSDEILQPSVKNGWIHQMTCIRELHIHGEKLYQQPISELHILRGFHHQWVGKACHAPELNAQCLELKIQVNGALTLCFSDQIILSYDHEGIVLSRQNWKDNQWQHRYWMGCVNQLHILCDHSSVEIFINQGAGVMSSRHYPLSPAVIKFSGEADLQLDYWELSEAKVS